MNDNLTDYRIKKNKAQNQLKSFKTDCKVENTKGKKLLEIGFKNGLFLKEAEGDGFIAIGTEVNERYFINTKKRFPELDIKLVSPKNGRIPHAKNSVDYVVSFQVLEHVNSTKEMLDESLRVLKRGGVMYHVCPNYNSFYEGHFDVLWLPFLNKKTGSFYLKLIGKYLPYWETINVIKPVHIKKWAHENKNNIELISYGKEEFVRKFDSDQIEKVNEKCLKKILRMLMHKDYILRVLSHLNIYYPLTIIIRKK